MKSSHLLVGGFLIFVIQYQSYVKSQSFGEMLKERAKQTLERKVENSVDRAVSNTYDKAEEKAVETGKEAVKKDKKKKKNKESEQTSDEPTSNATKNDANAANESNSNDNKGNSSTSLAVYSKYDFVPGEKLICFEDFSQDNVGDFPDKWNTNGSGEVVTLNKAEGKFFKTNKECVFYPEFIKDLPDNFTLEFDLAVTDNYSFYSGHFIVGATSESEIGKNFHSFGRFSKGNISNGGGFEVALHPTAADLKKGMTFVYSSFNNEKIIENENEFDAFSTGQNKTFVHVAIWRQKQRIRVYVNESKVWDLPKLVPEGVKLNRIYFRNDGGKDDEGYFISNLRLAVGAPDTRNKLITEGKFVTTGILFNVNSDKIKPESYGVLKEIATVLKENPDVRIKIIGHTDADGDEKFNLELSKKRAISVKNALIKEFGIDEKRMETDGKGESEPVGDNKTLEGKAMNRRVEFIKL